MDLFESVFLRDRREDFNRLARQTKGELTADDLRSESFLMALHLSERQQRQLDLACPLDQDLIIGSLRNKFVKWSDRVYKIAVRIDQQEEGEDGMSSWFLQLPAEMSSDPLVQLELNEEQRILAKILKSSFSQLSAYIVIFSRFDDDRDRICKYLAIVKKNIEKAIG